MSEHAEHLRHLTELLGSLPGMLDRDARTHLIGVLRASGTRFDPVRGGTDESDIAAIAEYAASRPGLLHELLEAMSTDHRGSEHHHAAMRYCQEVLPSQWFTLWQRDTLIDLLRRTLERDQAPWRSVERLYRAALSRPGAGTGAPHDADGLIRALELLPVPRSDGRERLHPLLSLLCLLDERYGELTLVTTSADLPVKRLAREIADLMGGDQPLLLLRRRRDGHDAAARAPARPTLVVRLAPKGTDQRRFLLDTWFMWDEDGGARCTRLDPAAADLDAATATGDDAQEALSLERVRELVPHLLEQALEHKHQNQISASDQLVIEFILPRGLMAEDVHLWLGDTDQHDSFLGLDYPVVVRDLVRQRSWRLLDKARARWEAIAEGRHTAGVPHRWVGCAETEAHRHELRRDLLLHRDWVSVGLCSPAPGDRSSLRTALDEGVPIAVWRTAGCTARVHGTDGARDTSVDPSQNGLCEGARFRLELTTCLDGTRLDDLQMTLYEKRKVALLADKPLRHLAVLWDDPTRSPPRERLGRAAP